LTQPLLSEQTPVPVNVQSTSKPDATPRGKQSNSKPSASSFDWLFSPNPVKAGGERYFLWNAVYWISIMAVIVATRAFETFEPFSYMLVGYSIAIPCIVWPIFFPPIEEAHLPLTQRYTFKNNVWVFIVSFYALWVWQHYFYQVLCTFYSFSRDQYRINNVPIALFMITQGYFAMYHTVSDIALRQFRRRFPNAPHVVFFVFLFAFCSLVAFAETFTIQNFPYYVIRDQRAMYIYGSLFYALYFIFTFVMHAEIDEEKRGKPSSLREVVINAFAACGMVTMALEIWRVSLGPIVWARVDFRVFALIEQHESEFDVMFLSFRWIAQLHSAPIARAHCCLS
jgi:cycloeucalenol cycloisomerase